MNSQITMNNVNVILHNNIPVITTELLAKFYSTEPIRIRQNHHENKDRFVCAITLAEPLISNKIPNNIIYLGDISFSLYLLHNSIGMAIMKRIDIPHNNLIISWLVVLMAITASVFAAHFTHKYFTPRSTSFCSTLNCVDSGASLPMDSQPLARCSSLNSFSPPFEANVGCSNIFLISFTILPSANNVTCVNERRLTEPDRVQPALKPEIPLRQFARRIAGFFDNDLRGVKHIFHRGINFFCRRVTVVERDFKANEAAIVFVSKVFRYRLRRPVQRIHKGGLPKSFHQWLTFKTKHGRRSVTLKKPADPHNLADTIKLGPFSGVQFTFVQQVSKPLVQDVNGLIE
uniref:KilA-N DNA-binding domain-containing protein n=1 Tax=Glossina brevipalpis TaxID=37001 RepID=A0A1A9WSH6_9MUSC